MKWETNIVGHPISVAAPISGWQKQAAIPTTTEAVCVDPPTSVTLRSKIMDLSDNIMLAHYQRDRR